MITYDALCPFTGEWNSMELPITEQEYERGMEQWMHGALIQNAFPMLNADQREFINTGVTPQKWAELFREED